MRIRLGIVAEGVSIKGMRPSDCFGSIFFDGVRQNTRCDIRTAFKWASSDGACHH